jgi:hypothetical protein
MTRKRLEKLRAKLAIAKYEGSSLQKKEVYFLLFLQKEMRLLRLTSIKL